MITLPNDYSDVSIDDLDPEARALLESAVPIAADEWSSHKGSRRRWSKEGTLRAVLLVLAVRDEILPLALENHRYNHRWFRAFPCSPRCLACDLWATLWLCAKAIGPSKDWPIRRLLQSLIEEASDYHICDLSGFADQVARALTPLSAVQATPSRKRTVAERRLAATYNVTSRLKESPKQSVSIGAGDIEKK